MGIPQGHLGPYFSSRSLRILEKMSSENLYLLNTLSLFIFKNTPNLTAMDLATDFAVGIANEAENSSKRVELRIRLANTVRQEIIARANPNLLDRLR